MANGTQEPQENPFRRLRDGDQEEENPFASVRGPTQPQPEPEPEEPSLFDRALAIGRRAREAFGRVREDTDDLERTTVAGTTGARSAPAPREDPETRGRDLELDEEGDFRPIVEESTEAPGGPVQPARPGPAPNVAPAPPGDEETGTGRSAAATGTGWEASMRRREERRRRLPGQPRPDPFELEDPLGDGELRYRPPTRTGPEGEELGYLQEALRVFPRGVGMTIESIGSMVQASDIQRESMRGGMPGGRSLSGKLVEETTPLIPGQRAAGRFVQEGGRQVREQFPASASVQRGGAFQPTNPSWWIASGGDVLFTVGVSMGTGWAASGMGMGRVAQLAAFSSPTAILEGGGAYAETYERLSEAGMSDEEAHAIASGTAFMTAAGATLLEQGPGRLFMFDELPGLQGAFGKRLAERIASSRPIQVGVAMTTESLQETSQEAWGDVVSLLVGQDPDAFADWFQRYAAAGTLGAFAGGVARTGQMAAGRDTSGQDQLNQLLEGLPQDVRADVERALGVRPSSGAAAPTVAPAPADVQDQPPEGVPERRSIRNRMAMGVAGLIDPSIWLDEQFGVQSRQAYQRAFRRLDARPDLSAVILDVINLHGMNEILGSHKAADDFMHPLLETIKEIHAELGGKTRDLFRRDGDAFVAYVPKGVENEFLVAVQDRIGLRPIGDSDFVTGFRAAAGPTSTEADQELFHVKNQETFRRFRDEEGAEAPRSAADPDENPFVEVRQETEAQEEPETPPPGWTEEELAAWRQAEQDPSVTGPVVDVPEAETVTEAAVRLEDGTIVTGGTHASIQADLIEQGRLSMMDEDLNGFVTSTGRFVDRVDGTDIADRAGQLDPESPAVGSGGDITVSSEELGIASDAPTTVAPAPAGQLNIMDEAAAAEPERLSREEEALARARARAPFVEEGLDQEFFGRLDALAQRDDDVGRAAQRAVRMVDQGNITPAEVVEDIARIEDELAAAAQEPINLGVLQRLWEEQTGTELPSVFEEIVPRRLFVEEQSAQALPDPHDVRASIVNHAAIATQLATQLEEGVSPDQEEITPEQRSSMEERLQRIQGQLREQVALFRAAFGEGHAQRVIDAQLDPDNDPVTRMTDKVRPYTKPAQLRRFAAEFSKWSDEKLLERYQGYVRTWNRMLYKGTQTEARDQRASMNNWGEIVTGTATTESGFKARGNRSQAASRIHAAAMILRSRGVPIPTEREITSEVVRADLAPWNRDFYDELPGMSVESLQAELEDVRREWGRTENMAAPELPERIMLIYRELERRGVPDGSAIINDHGLEPGDGVRERRPSWVVREGAADMEGWWYTRTMRSIDQIPFAHPKVGEKWWAWIRKSQEGVTETEIEWVGLREWLLAPEQRHRELTREEVVAAAERAPRLTETRYGGPLLPSMRAGQDVEILTNPEPGPEGSRPAVMVAVDPTHRRVYARVEFDANLNEYWIIDTHRAEIMKRTSASHPDALERARELVDEVGRSAARGWAERNFSRYTKHGGWTFQGFGRTPGSGYTEIIVQVPELGGLNADELVSPKVHQRIDELLMASPLPPGVERSAYSFRNEAMAFDARARGIMRFRAHGHWGDLQNPLAHLRLTHRSWGGEKIAFGEEFQSDLHQKGRANGYVDVAAELGEELAEYHAAQEALLEHGLIDSAATMERDLIDIERPFRDVGYVVIEQEVAEHFQAIHPHFRGDDELVGIGSTAEEAVEALRGRMQALGSMSANLHNFTPEWRTLTWEEAATLNRLRAARKQLSHALDRFEVAGKVPDAPFKDTKEWVGMMVRRLFQEAALLGNERVAVINGDQVLQVFNLRRHVERVVWSEKDNQLEAYDANGVLVRTHTVPPEQLPDYVGKDLAETLKARARAAGWEVWFSMTARQDLIAVGATKEEAQANAVEVLEQGTDLSPAGGRVDRFLDIFTHTRRTPGSIEGQEIELGGHGRAYFYDTIVAGLFRDEAARLGLEVEEIVLDQRTDDTGDREVITVGEGVNAVFLSVPPLPDARLRLALLSPQLEEWDTGRAPAAAVEAGHYIDDLLGSVNEIDRADNLARSLASGLLGEEAAEIVADVLDIEDLISPDQSAKPNLSVKLTPEARLKILNDGLPLVREQLEVTFGSEEAALDVFDEIRQLGIDAEGRLEIVRSVGSQARIDLRGQTAADPRTVALMVRPWRSKTAETAGFMFLDADGKVLGVQTTSSGAIDQVEFSKRQRSEIVLQAQKLGAAKITFWHNHPSGDPKPSPEDLFFLKTLHDFMVKRGGPAVDGVIINDTTAVEISDPAGWGDLELARIFTSVMGNQRVPAEQLPGWRQFELGTEPTERAPGPQIRGPMGAAAVVKDLEGTNPETFMVLYMDTRNRVIVAEPMHRRTLPTIGTWLKERMSAYGSRSTVIVAGGRVLIGDVGARVLDANMNWVQVMDIVEPRPDGSVRSAGTESAWTSPGGNSNLRDKFRFGLVKEGDGRQPYRTDLFGNPVEGEARQEELLGPAPTDTLSSAQATVSRLEGRVQRGVASEAEVVRYEQARSLIRQNEGRGLDEAEVRARRVDDGTPHPDDNLDLFETRERGPDYDPTGPNRADEIRTELEQLEDEEDALGDDDADMDRWDEIDERVEQLQEELEVAELIETGKVEEAAAALWGLTDSPSEAVYILADGSYLDGSGSNEGGPGGQRAYDHRQVGGFYSDTLADGGSGRAFMIDFMRRGNIRFSVSGGIVFADFIGQRPRDQLEAIIDAAEGQDQVMLVRTSRDGTPFAERMLEEPTEREIEEAWFELRDMEEPDSTPIEPREVPRGEQTNEEADGFPEHMEPHDRGDVPVLDQTSLPTDPIAFDQLIAPMLPGRLVQPPKPAPGAPVSSPQVISAIAEVTRAAGRYVPIRIGRLVTKRTLGEFKVWPEVARTLMAHDIPTSAHEMAHALEKVVWGRPKGTPWTAKIAGISKAMEKQLVQLGRDLYGDRKPAAGYKREGWAEFVRAWVTNDQATIDKAPAFAEWFRWEFLGNHPEIEEAMNNARAMAWRYQAQGSLARGRANMVDVNGIAERMRYMRRTLREAFTIEKWIEMAKPLHDLAQAAEQRADVDPEDNPWTLVDALRTTHAARVKRMVDDNMIDLAGNPVGPALSSVRGLVNNDQYWDFGVYLWAKRAVALLTDPKGSRDPGLSLQDAQQIIDELETPAFSKAAAIVYEWNAGVLNYGAQASPIFKRIVEAVRERDPGNYVPLQRFFDEIDSEWAARPQGAAASSDSPVKSLKGSGRRVRDVMQSMISQAESIVRSSHNRAVIDAIVKMAKIEGMGHIIEEVPKSQVPVAHRSVVDLVDEVRRRLRQGDVDQELDLEVTVEGEQVDLASMEEELGELMVTFFAPPPSPDSKDPIVPIYEGEERGVRWYQVDPNLYAALGALDVYRLPASAGLPVLEWTFGKATNTFRAGTTGLNASFGLLWNPLRDFQTFYVNTRSSASTPRLLMELLRALSSAAFYRTTGTTKNPYLEAFLNLGGEMAQPLGQDIPHTRRAARRIVQGRVVRSMDPRNWFDWFRDFVQFPESAPRVAELKLVAKEIGWEPGTPMTVAQSYELLRAAKHVTTDFTAAGEFARALNRMVPFHNASIQGPRANVRAARRAPGRFAWRGMQLAALSLLLWWRNKDEEWWHDLTPVERATHWWFSVQNGDREELVRIPRAFEVGMVFSALPETLADAWYHQDPAAAGAWLQTFVKVSAPPLVPVLVDVAAEQIGNEQFYWDRPIVPMRQQGLPLEEQYNEYTSVVARVLGDMFGASPMRIDHAIQGIFGGVSRDIIEAVGLGGEGPGRGGAREAEAGDIPIVGRAFYRGGVEGPDESVNQLYEALDRAQRRQRSRRQPETAQERDKRLLMQDAAQSLVALGQVRRAVGDVENRRQLMKLERDIARSALEAAGGQRAAFTRFRQMWERRAEIVERGTETPNP